MKPSTKSGKNEVNQMQKVISSILSIYILLASPVGARTNPVGTIEDLPYPESHDGSYGVFFLTILEHGKVYRVIFSTLRVIPSKSNLDIFNGQCFVALEEIPNETADSYRDVVKFVTSIHVVIFMPNSEFPMDVVAFEYAFKCYEYDDMQ